eukprot:s6953_g3.t1
MDLPEPWTGHTDPDTGRTFYYNKVTKDATWRRPSEPQRLPLDVDLPAPWEAHRAQGTDWTFYYNKITGNPRGNIRRQPSHPRRWANRSQLRTPPTLRIRPGMTLAMWPLIVRSLRRPLALEDRASSPQVDAKGRLRPKPKKMPRRADTEPAGSVGTDPDPDIPYTARFEIQAGDLLLKSATAVQATSPETPCGSLSNAPSGSRPDQKDGRVGKRKVASTEPRDDRPNDAVASASPRPASAAPPTRRSKVTRPKAKPRSKRKGTARVKPYRSIWFDVDDVDGESGPPVATRATTNLTNLAAESKQAAEYMPAPAPALPLEPCILLRLRSCSLSWSPCPRRELNRERHVYQLVWPVPPFFASSGHSCMSSAATTRLILSGPAVHMTLHIHAFFSLKV